MGRGGLRGWGRLAQLVKCLAFKLEDLSLDPLHLYKKPGALVPVCAPFAGEVETGGPCSSLADSPAESGRLLCLEN